MPITYAVRDNGDGTKTVVATDVQTITDNKDLVRRLIKDEINNLKVGKQNNQDQIAVINARITELRDLLTAQKALFDEAEGVDPDPIP